MPTGTWVRVPEVAVIGGGPAGLMAAEVLAGAGVRVTLYDRMPSLGRKFLLAGRGGLNLTHSEDRARFMTRYAAAAPQPVRHPALDAAIEAFSPADLRAWCEGLGEPTFVGSSGRVFPASFKTSPLLRAWLRRLAGLGVMVRPRHRWTGWGPDGALTIEGPEGAASLRPDACVLALGGASWPQVGSDGSWVAPLRSAGIEVQPLRPSNCGFVVAWSRMFRERFEGVPLKGIGLSFGGTSLRGEAMVTRTGLEGGGIYALSAMLRDAIDERGEAVLRIALRPDLSVEDLARRLAGRPAKQSLSTFLGKALRLAPVAVGLLWEAAIAAGETLSAPPAESEERDAAGRPVPSSQALALRINDVPVRLTGTMPIGRAISTAGGVGFDALDDALMLRRRPGCFVAGEMLDWEAPTGGYLLQAAFATGAMAGHGALAWLRRGASVAAR